MRSCQPAGIFRGSFFELWTFRRLTSRWSQPPLAVSVPPSRFTSRVGGGSAFYVRPHRAHGMILYPEGTEVRIGDAVLLHHRTYTGTVQHIIDSPAEVESWNTEEPGLMVDSSFGMVFLPKDSLTHDEITFV